MDVFRRLLESVRLKVAAALALAKTSIGGFLIDGAQSNGPCVLKPNGKLSIYPVCAAMGKIKRLENEEGWFTANGTAHA